MRRDIPADQLPQALSGLIGTALAETSVAA